MRWADWTACSNLGSFTTECATWQLLTDTDATDALTHYFCDYSSTTYSVFGSWPTTIPEVTTSTSSYSCIAESFSADNPGDCASPIGIILPLILSNVVYFCINALAGNFKFQNWCQFWKRGRDQIEPEDYAWTPWPGLGSAALVVIQAAVTAYLVRAGGYGASFKDLILLWLVRPRMMWSQMLFYVARGIEYKGAATDAFFADVLLNLFSIPVLSSTVTIALKFKDICDAGEFVSQRYRPSVDENGTMVVRAFGSDSQTFLLSIYTYFYLAASSMGIFALAFFLYKRRLRRWWTIVPLFWSLTTFIASWLFWTSKYPWWHDRFPLRLLTRLRSRFCAVFGRRLLLEEHRRCVGDPRRVPASQHTHQSYPGHMELWT